MTQVRQTSGETSLAWIWKDLPVPFRFPMLVLGFASLLIGLAAGLARLGLDMPEFAVRLIPLHGPLMVCCFFGTLISLERAVAVGQRWAYAAPLFGAIGAVLLLAGFVQAGAFGLTLASLGLTLTSWSVWRRQRAVFTATLLLGAISWLLGNLLWVAGWPVAQAVPWWAGFLVITIAGERLELSRMLPPSANAQRLFVGLLLLWVGAMVVSILQPLAGARIVGLILILLTIWLLRNDIARRTIKSKGLTRYIAVCLMSGYGWLLVGGMLQLGQGLFIGGMVYDAALHALFLGFVFSMVFGHAPIILPAITRFNVDYHPVFYFHLALLHISLALRIIADVGELGSLKNIAASLNAVTLVVFMINTVLAVVRGRRKQKMGC